MQFSLTDMFPSFEGSHELDHRQITILELCAKNGLPFPAEKNKAYGNWWHSLHEVGHWAVKPDWYIQYAKYLMDDLKTAWGSLNIPSGTVQGVNRDINLTKVGKYTGGNDVIPEIGLYRDPTPGEHETRVWSLQVIKAYGWHHPFDDNITGVTTGDSEFQKPASARVWATPLLDNPEILTKMSLWGLDVANGHMRATDPSQTFALPCPHPRSCDEMVVNMDAIYDRHPDFRLNREERAYWLDYLSRRWSNKDLEMRAERTTL